jgi:hypothetical protein
MGIMSLASPPPGGNFQLVSYTHQANTKGPLIQKAFSQYLGLGQTSLYVDNLQGKDNPLFFVTKVTGVRSLKTGKVYRSKVEKMQDLYGMKWVEFRNRLYEFYLDPTNDQAIIDYAFDQSVDSVPIRSGFLYDQLYLRSRIFRNVAKGVSKNRFWYGYNTIWPRLFRPRPIPGKVQHSIPATGYAKVWTPLSKNTRARVHLLYVTKGGYGLYQLNDVAALNDPMPTILNNVKQALANYYANGFIRMEVTLRLPNTGGIPDTARVLKGVRPQPYQAWAK